MCCIYGVGLRVEVDGGARRRDEVADDDVRDYYWHFALLGCLAECSFGSVVEYCSSGSVQGLQRSCRMTE